MYILKETGVLAFNKIVKTLSPYIYEPMPHTTVLSSHKTRKTTFALCVDNIGVKYFSKEYANYIINAL